MDCVKPILDVATCLWASTSKRVAYVRELESNLKTLKIAMGELNNLSKDVIERIQHEEALQQRRRTHVVQAWLDDVQVMGAEVERILQDGDQEIQNKCLRFCPKNCCLSYKLGKIVTEKVNGVRLFISSGSFAEVTQRLPYVQVEERSMGKTVALDRMFKKVERSLVDEQVRGIGLYGIGGVGKTTFLQKINNDFFGKRSDFLVIWVVVSKPINIEKIQEVILKRLQVPNDDWKSSSKEEKATMILNLLKAKNFVILLDDMWERLNLFEVGIPRWNDQTKSKLVLTTRSEQVCDEMGVRHKFKVECLTPNEAFSLFCDNVGANIIELHPDIKRLANIVVEECKGLPLALVVIGRSMASRKTPQEWEQAIRMLQSYPAKFSGMGDQVFPILKFSYDHLGNDTLKSCFLHCSLFPEDHIFSKSELINLWIGEGFLSEWDDIYEARNQGEEIIRNLKLACLLEGNVTKNIYKMHDTIRDMGRWLSCDYGEEKQKNFVVEHVQLIEAFEIGRWKVAQRIFLWHCNFKKAPCVSPCFPNLQTFLMRYSSMKTLPIGFFQFMPIIRVLDLSDNENLKELPLEICRLGSLEYLNLAKTGIKKVPIELKELEKLRCLILDSMLKLQAIPPGVITCLLSLQMFNMTDLAQCIKGYEECLQELECLPCLSEIRISLNTSSAYEIFFNSQKLQKCTQYLALWEDDWQGLHLPISTLQKLKELSFNCCFLSESVMIKEQSDQEEQTSMPPFHISNPYFHNLVTVSVTYCGFVDLTWLIYAPCLENLSIYACLNMKGIIGGDDECEESEIEDKMEEIIGGDDECEESEIEEQDHCVFSRLAVLCLRDLPELKSIYMRPLPFPSLMKITVYKCPKLRKLPLNSNSATSTLKTIEGFSSWWEGLEWESDLLKTTFAPYFKSAPELENLMGFAPQGTSWTSSDEEE